MLNTARMALSCTELTSTCTNGEVLSQSLREHNSKQDRRDDGEQDVHRRAGDGDPDHVPAGISQLAEFHRHGFGIAEKEARGEKQHGRKQDRAERIDMLEGVERHPSLILRRGIAEMQRDIAVRCLMEGDRDDHRNRKQQDLFRSSRSICDSNRQAY